MMATNAQPALADAARSAAAAVFTQPDAGNDTTSWLLSVAAGEYKLHNYPALVARCSEMITNEDLHVYHRGMAVTALGKTLEREIERTTRAAPHSQGERATIIDSVRQVRNYITNKLPSTHIMLYILEWQCVVD